MKNLYYVLSGDRKVETSAPICNRKAAVLICLYYEEQVADYLRYIERIPDFIDVYIISSREQILEQFRSGRYRTIKKENRGRDISALLVATSEVVFQYEYVCFIHDKKEKHPDAKSYVDFWKKNLWENMLGSDVYICNLLDLFERRQELGMLVPLPPYKDGDGIWLDGAWSGDYENTKNLADMLGLRVPILQGEPPYAVSTVFWARTKALKKLYAKKWDYTDFPEEPIKNDGEINHAVERVLQYVVEDVGYETCIVINSLFAATFIQQLHDELQYIWKNLRQTFHVRNYNVLEHYQEVLDNIKKFWKTHDRIFLYGAGIRGRDCLAICRLLDIIPEGILVTYTQDNQKDVEGVPVLSIDRFVPDDSTGIIVAVGITLQDEIVQELEKRGISDYMIFY